MWWKCNFILLTWRWRHRSIFIAALTRCRFEAASVTTLIRRWLVICSVTFLVKLFWMSIKWCWYIIEICKFIWSNSPLDNTIVSSTSWSQTLSLSHKYPWKKCPCVHLPLTINLIQTNGNQLMNCFGWWRPRQPLLQTTKKKWLRAPRHYNYPQDKKKICN